MLFMDDSIHNICDLGDGDGGNENADDYVCGYQWW